ncbi:MAG TPA: NAD-dependent epimerase/dehydratase family protein, partial [Candidatus Eisenbacteria bacterium]|nr:NAD-dependent epimerase/dehydratase family protein [Candidatus Eisenbacteria bacterium]
VEAVYHLAAVASVQASVDDPFGTHATNLVGTLNLLEAARRNGVRRIVYASSAAVYGDTIELPVREEAAPRPLSPYAADKLAGEHYLLFYAREYGLAATAFRFFNIYGPRQDPSSPYSGVISIFVERARTGEPVTIFGDGEQTRDFVYVADLVEVLYRALDHAGTDGQVLNVGGGRECSLLDILAELERLCGGPIERRHELPRIGDIRRSCADITRLVALLGYRPQTLLGTGLERLLAYGHRPVP